MPRSTFFVAILALGWIGAAALAGETTPRRSDGGQPGACCDAGPCCCPDTYCKKPLPCVPPVKLGCGCDTYCKKPLPSVPPVKLGCGCDTYCKKPWPDLCRPLDRQFYRCPPSPCEEGESMAPPPRSAKPPSASTESKPPAPPKPQEDRSKQS